MSGAIAALSGVAAVAGALDAVLIRPLRAIGTVIPNVVVEEHHRDEIRITRHPVERGAATTDHFYKEPSEVAIRCAFGNSGEYETYVQDAYGALLTLQVSGQFFAVVTGKRLYPVMLLETLEVNTDASTEYTLDVTAVCREVILVDTTAAPLPPQANQATPSQTAAVQPQGQQTLQPTTNPPNLPIPPVPPASGAPPSILT